MIEIDLDDQISDQNGEKAELGGLSAGVRATSITELHIELTAIRRLGSRSSSRRARAGWTSRAVTIAIATTIQIAVRQPDQTVTNGPSRPTMTPPKGTPLCLIEKTTPRIRAGVTRAKTWLPAGVAGP